MYILISNNLGIPFSSFKWRLLMFTFFYIVLQKIFSCTPEKLSTWFLQSISSMSPFLAYFLWFFGFIFENLSLMWPSILQYWLQWLFGSKKWCVVGQLSSYPFLFSYYLNPWKCLGDISSWNQKVFLSSCPYSPNTMHVHRPSH